jgi:hypothetical protein
MMCEDWVLYYELFNSLSNYYCTDIMYLYLTCPISYDVNLYLDIRNVNKFNSVSFYASFIVIAN